MRYFYAVAYRNKGIKYGKRKDTLYCRHYQYGRRYILVNNT